MKQLSPREKEIIGLISKGRKTKEIAIDLGISTRTVDAHRSSIMQKLEAVNLSQAIRIAIELGDIVLSSIAIGYLIERDQLTKDIIKAVDNHLEPTGVYDLKPIGKIVGYTGEGYTGDDNSNK